MGTNREMLLWVREICSELLGTVRIFMFSIWEFGNVDFRFLKFGNFEMSTFWKFKYLRPIIYNPIIH